LIDRLGAEIRLIGTDLDFAKDEGKRFAAESRLPFFEDGVEPTQFDGYGVIADDILDQLTGHPAVVARSATGAIGGIGGRCAPRGDPVVMRRGEGCLG
jgi:threonine dehydratase